MVNGRNSSNNPTKHNLYYFHPSKKSHKSLECKRISHELSWLIYFLTCLPLQNFYSFLLFFSHHWIILFYNCNNLWLSVGFLWLQKIIMFVTTIWLLIKLMRKYNKLENNIFYGFPLLQASSNHYIYFYIHLHRQFLKSTFKLIIAYFMEQRS